MSAPELPRQLGRYRLLKALGRGAMGVVYEAEDPQLGRRVAIKTILQDSLHDQAVVDDFSRRFRREAQAAGRLNHPHIVTVHDFGRDGATSYIVMEYVRGRDLAGVLAGGERFAVAESVRVVVELLDALAYAHDRGVVHRDVKPANVLLDEGGQVKLADFGVARIVDSHADRTMPGTLVGSPSYMSPEQIQGQAVGSRTDVFAVGVVLYQLLTGRKPFEGGGPFAVQRKIVQEDPMPPSRVDAQVPRAFDVVVMRALAKRPDDRFDSARAFAEALIQALRVADTKTQGGARRRPTAGVPLPLARGGVDSAGDDAAAARRAVVTTVAVSAFAAATVVSAWWWLSRPAPVTGQAPLPPAQHGVVAPADRAPVPAGVDTVPTVPPPAVVFEPPAPPLSTQDVPAPPVRPEASIDVSDAPGHAADPPRRSSLGRSGTAGAVGGAGMTAPRDVPAAARRCADLTQRLQLGEPLGSDDLAFLENSCRR